MRAVQFDRLKARVARDLTSAQRGELLVFLGQAARDDLAGTVRARGAQAVLEDRACRRCHHTDIVRHGFDAGPHQRFRCRKGAAGGCGRTFNGMTGTALAGMRKPDKWVAVAAAMQPHRSVSKTAKAAGVSRLTAFRWRHKLLGVQAARGSARIGGIVEVGETFLRDPFKGSRVRGAGSAAIRQRRAPTGRGARAPGASAGSTSITAGSRPS